MSEHVDEDYEKEREAARTEAEDEKARSMQIEEFMNPVEFQEVVVSPHPRRPVPVLETTQATPTTPPPSTPLLFTHKPSVRKIRNTNDKFKDVIATVSYRSALCSKIKSSCTSSLRQTVWSQKRRFQPTLPSIEEVEEPRGKKPSKAADYKMNYEDVLPSAKVVTTYKHERALHQEIAAARCLSSLDDDTRCTLHFDTTGRNRVDGEWPALILNFLSSDIDKCQMFRLCALFFAYEDRDQIVKLIVETLQRLSVAADDEHVKPKSLWGNIYALMTDAVTKNLKVEEAVARELQTEHIPLHLLCKSHKLDGSCIDA